MRTLLVVSLRSLSWRRWATAGLVAASVAAFAAAAVGPLWANAAEDSMLAQTFRATGPADGSSLVQVTARGNDSGYGSKQIPALAEQEARQAARMPAPMRAAFDPPRRLISTSGGLLVRGLPADEGDERPGGDEPPGGPATDGPELMAPMSWSRHGCASVDLVVGSCPDADTEVVVSSRTARVLHVTVGDAVVVPALADEPPAANTGAFFPSTLDVVGVYRAPDVRSRDWVGWELAFQHAAGDPDARDPVLPRTETMFVVHDLMLRLAVTPVVARDTRVLALPSVDADAVDALAAQLGPWDLQRRELTGTVALVNEPLAAITQVQDQRAAVRLASWVAALQLLGLVWYVLYLLTSAAADGRSHDVALAKLRGLRPRTVTLVAVLEPVLVVLLALPVGLLLAVGLVRVAGERLLPGDVGLRVDGSVGLAALVALTGACLAAVAAVRTTVTERALVQLQGGRRVWTPRGLLLAEAAVVTLSAAALWQVFRRRDDDDLDGLVLLAPGLAAAGVGVLAARLLRAGSLMWARRTRHRPRHPAYLASRHVGRRQHGTRVAVFAAVAVSLAVFAASCWGVGERQRAGQTAMAVGADRVLSVSATSPAELVDAVRRVDPSGRSLMAAAELDSGNTARRVLAVDSERFAAVSAWQREWGLAPDEVPRRLVPLTAPTLRLTGPTLTVDLDLQASTDVSLVASLVDDAGVEHRGSVALGGDGPQTARLEVDGCGSGCRLAGLSLVRQPGATGLLVGEVTFSRLVDDGREVPDAFARSGWRSSRLNEDLASSTQTSRIERAGAAGLTATYNVGPTDVPGIDRADVPEALPLVITPGTTLTTIGRDELVTVSTLDGYSAPALVTGRAWVLPRLQDVGALVDLPLALRRSGAPLPSLRLQVWVAPGAAGLPALTRQLADAGVDVTGSTSLTAERARLDRSGPALSLLLLLGVAAAALVVAVLAVVGLALVHGRARAVETAALRTAGVGRDTLRSAARWEYVLQLGTGVVAGLVAGVVTADGLALSVTRIGLAGAVAPVTGDLPAGWLTGVVGVTVVAFLVLSTVCAGVTVRAARPERVREVGA